MKKDEDEWQCSCSENEVKPRMAVAFKPGKTVTDLYGKELEPGTAEL